MMQAEQQEYEMHEASTIALSRRSSFTVRDPATMSIHTKVWAIAIFLFYTGLALLSWIMLCIMNKRPIQKEKSYHSARTVGYYPTDSYDPTDWYLFNEKNFNAAQVLHSITALFTIPITTAICSMACVAYMQAGSLRRNLSLNQSMALADQGWVSPMILVKFKTLGSLPLYIALALTLIGSMAQILQSAFVKPESILASAIHRHGGSVGVKDVHNLISREDDTLSDHGEFIVKLRGLMQSPYSSDGDANDWGVPYLPNLTYNSNGSDQDTVAGHIYVPLASNFTIGAFPTVQYAPRMNSSISYVGITESEFKEKCRNETDKGGFYAKYEHHDEKLDFSLETCMPPDLRTMAWNVTRDRQDIVEELYLGIHDDPDYAAEPGLTYWKATANTTLGYFELPSELNGNTPGELLAKDPFHHDTIQLLENIHKRATNMPNMSYTGSNLIAQGVNRGPLAAVALALFGRHSYVESRMSNPSRFVLTDHVGYHQYVCVSTHPLSNWLGKSEGACTYDYGLKEERYVYGQVITFLEYFCRESESKKDLLDGLSNALFMANKLWLGGTTNDTLGGIQITYDQGFRTIKPKISQTGVIVGSVFLGAHLLGLLALATYVAVMKPWSGTMGAEVMLKMGMAYSDVLATLETERQWEGTVNQLPGFIGDAKPTEEVGQLSLGALAALSRKDGRKFEILR